VVRARLAWRPLVLALRAWQGGDREATLRVRSDVGEDEEWPVGMFFRGEDELPEIERAALDRCGHAVVDVGAGAGPHALVLQDRGHDVLALESTPEMADLLRARGVRRVAIGGPEAAPRSGADTVLMLMNGLGLAGTLAGLGPLLRSAGGALAPGGRILADSTDLRTSQATVRRDDGRYIGEVQFQLEFRGVRGEPFPFVYVDPDTLARQARAAGLELLESLEFGDGTYLAVLAVAAATKGTEGDGVRA
jgi:SAM-dependent methyltransferase